jgi:hypothetical protein
VARREIQRANVVQGHGHVMIEGENGQGLFRLRLEFHMKGAAIACRTAGFEALAYVVVRDDRRLLLEVLVAASVIGVVVRVDNKPNWLVGNAFQHGLNLVGQRSVLIVHHHDTVVAQRRPDVSARTFQYVHIAGYFADLPLHLAEVVVLGRDQAAPKERDQSQNRQSKLVHTPSTMTD